MQLITYAKLGYSYRPLNKKQHILQVGEDRSKVDLDLNSWSYETKTKQKPDTNAQAKSIFQVLINP